MPKPLRRYACTAQQCKRGGQHEYGKCDKAAKVKYKCGGELSAAYGGCIGQKEAENVKITNKMAQRNTAQSNSITPGNQVQTQGPILMHGACTHKCKADNDTLLVNKVHFVDVAEQLKKEIERIKIIVEAAGGFLDVRDVKADQVHALLIATEVGGIVLYIVQWNARDNISKN